MIGLVESGLGGILRAVQIYPGKLDNHVTYRTFRYIIKYPTIATPTNKQAKEEWENNNES